MEHGDALEALAESAHGLRRERYLRDHDDAATPGPDARVERLEIDLRLATAGDAEEQECLVPPRGDRVADGARRLCLRREERRGRAARHGEALERMALDGALGQRHGVDRRQPARRPRVDAGRAQLGQRALAVLFEQRDGRVRLCRAPRLRHGANLARGLVSR